MSPLRPRNDDRGIALITVILLSSVIVLTLTTIAVRTTSSLDQARLEKRREQALHTGDAGIDQTLALLTQNRYYSTVASDAELYSGFRATGAYDRKAERRWVIDQARTLAVRQGPEG